MQFLTSLAIIILSSIILSFIFSKIKLPGLVAMLIVGIVLGPSVLNLISPSILNISADLRQLALIIILTRAGLSLNIKDLIKVGRPAILLCFIPAIFEICGYIILGHFILKLTIIESMLMGCVLAAVSPAIVIPRMLKIQNEGYGNEKFIPQMITAGASCDDVFVIVIFTAILGVAEIGVFNFNIFWQIPVSIILGIVIGIIIGFLFSFLVNHFHMRDTIKVLIMLSISFLLVAVETLIKNYVPFSALLSIIALAVTFNSKNNIKAQRLSIKYNKLWVFAEILLFVLVGAKVDFAFIFSSVFSIIAVMLLALIFRTIGVFFSLIKTPLTFKEKVFCSIAYLPKATVQAAIGAIPLNIGLNCGQIILACSVLAILITAPLGAFATDLTYKKLLKHN